MANNAQLVKQWIRYLKNNQIVKLESDQKSGKLTYHREPTTDDVAKFLENETEYDPRQIRNVIQSVLSKKSGRNLAAFDPNASTPAATDPGTARHPPTTSSVRQDPQIGKKKFNNDDAEDIDYRSAKQPGSPKQVGMNARQLRELAIFPAESGQPGTKPYFKSVKEDIRDNFSPGVTEDDVEAIFAVIIQLTKDKASSKATAKTQNKDNPVLSPEQALEKKQESLRQIKRAIRDTMTDSQRQALWRLLNE